MLLICNQAKPRSLKHMIVQKKGPGLGILNCLFPHIKSRVLFQAVWETLQVFLILENSQHQPPHIKALKIYCNAREVTVM